MLKKYLTALYRRALSEAYNLAYREIAESLHKGGNCLDCGAYNGRLFEILSSKTQLTLSSYFGIEWNAELVSQAQAKKLNVTQGDLNKEISYPSNNFKCVFALSVLEHLLNPCKFLRETYRVLEEGGTLVLLTPNISTYFTAGLILLGKMPSSGPHPDSDILIKTDDFLKVSGENIQPDTEIDTPVHRHLVVFSYRVLSGYLRMIGFKKVTGYGFGLYPFPNFMQKFLEQVDPYHCHQMVFVAVK